ncbi:LysR family transcriptional regulator [Burkholderia cepacia]|uniref:LysR family transcriptional regulator n=1 Tax=Burkholderia cepacia TaxID=292 RepID=UPI002AB71BB2|nr:LysR substrate-binding domain-containing protein [Burkholderia cepacia]
MAMHLRHLRYFLALAEELHYARAAERLHIEQSLLSRAIRELEQDLGAELFERDTRGTRITWAGRTVQQDVRRLFALLDDLKANARSAASSYRGMLRVALSDGVVPQRLASLLALSREEEPDVGIQLAEVPLGEQLLGLRQDLYDAGFSQTADVTEGLVAEPVWKDRLVAVVPSRHTLLAHRYIPLNELLRFPLILCDPKDWSGTWRQIQRVLGSATVDASIAAHVVSGEMLLSLVSAGYGVGFASEARVAHNPFEGVVVRPLAETRTC